MGLKIDKTSVSSGVPIWQSVRVFETAQGGFTLDTTGLTADTVIPGGTPFTYDETTRLAKPLILATVYENAGGSATQYKVKKGSNLAIGQNLSQTIGGAAYAITAVDKSNADYDLVTVATTLGAATAGGAVYVSSANGASAGAFGFTVKGLSYEEVTVGVNVDVAIVIKGTVYARRIPAYPALVETTLKPGIIFSQSY